MDARSGSGGRISAAPAVITVGPAGLGARVWAGSGRPVLLVHGLSSNARLWDGVAEHLAAVGHPVVAVDLRGHGSSAHVPDAGPDATVRAAADLAEVCATLGWTASVVAGQSWGGNVALQLAADRPDLVPGLALVDGGWLHLGDQWDTLDAAWEVLAPPVFDGVGASALRARLTAAHPGWGPAAIEATMGNLREHPDGTVAPWLDRSRHRAIVASMLAHRPRELYPLVRCPVALLAATGPDDPPRRLEQIAAAQAGLSNAELIEFPGGDHDLHAQHPEKVATVIGGLT